MILKSRKFAVLVLTGGAMMFGVGGCLGLNIQRLLQFGAAYAASEFVFDNDGLLDLFPDSGAAAGN